MKSILITLLLISAISCSPMYYKDLGTEPSSSLSFDRDEYMLSAEDSGENIEVRFEAISNARSYGYGTSIRNVVKLADGEMSFSNGIYSVSIPKTSAALKGISSSGSALSKEAGKLSIIVFASTHDNPENDWIIVKSVAVDLVLEGPPSLSYSNRMEDSVVLEDKSNAEDITYSVTTSDGLTVEFDSDQLPYTLSGIGGDALTLTVSHKYTGTDEFAEEKQSIEIPAYDIRQSEIHYTVEEDGSVTVSNLPAGEYKHIGLYRVNASGQAQEISVLPYNGEGGEATFPSDTFGTGFYASSVKVIVYNETADDESAKLSEVFSYERDIEKLNERVGRQSYSVEIPVSSELNISSDNVKLSGVSGASVSVSDNMIRISASKLISLSDYTLTLQIDVPDYGPVTKTIGFTTRSFAGEYIWKASASGGAEQFAVIVEQAPEGSKGNYYVYTSPNDIAFSSGGYQKLRIAPLYESDSDFPSGGVSFSDAPEAYRWNNSKWNSSSQKPLSLSFIRTTYITRDNVSAVVGSKANAYVTTIEVETTSSTEFIEKEDGTCLLVFYNKMTGGSGIGVSMGNDALRKNPSPDESNFETDEYHYALVLQES